MEIYAYRRERGMTIEVSSRLLQSLTRKEKEMLRCFAVLILAFAGIACQLASIVGFVVVLLLTGVANVELVPQAERVGKGGNSPEQEEEKEELGEKSESQTGQHEIEEDEYREERLPNTRIKKRAKTAKSVVSLASRGNDAEETTSNPQSTRKQTRRRAQQNQAKSKA